MDLFLIITTLAPVLPLTIGLYRIKKLDLPFKLLILMVASEATISVYSTWQAYNGIFNIPSLYLLTVLEVLLGGLFIFLSISKKSYKWIIICLILVSISNTVYVSLINGSIYVNNPLNRSLQGYFMVIFALLYFYDLLQNKEVIRLRNDPTFWIATSFFIFFGTTQFLYLFGDFIIAYDLGIRNYYWKFHYMVSNSYYILLAVGLWKKK